MYRCDLPEQGNNPRAEDEDSAYVMGMDMFTALTFFWMVIVLLSTGVLTVSGERPENGAGSAEQQVEVYLDPDGNNVRIGNDKAPRLALSRAESEIRAAIEAQRAVRVVLAAPGNLATEKTQRCLDLLSGLTRTLNRHVAVALAVVD